MNSQSDNSGAGQTPEQRARAIVENICNIDVYDYLPASYRTKSAIPVEVFHKATKRMLKDCEKAILQLGREERLNGRLDVHRLVAREGHRRNFLNHAYDADLKELKQLRTEQASDKEKNV